MSEKHWNGFQSVSGIGRMLPQERAGRRVAWGTVT